MKSYLALTGDSRVAHFSSLLNSISEWASRWQLPLSLTKCGWMLISNRLVKRDFYFNLSGHALTKLSDITDLGVSYNSQLNFTPHFTNIVSKAKQRSFLLRKSFTSSIAKP